MCGVGKPCNELLTDILNQGNRNWIWPHFPSVRVSYIRAGKAVEVQWSGRKLTLNYVHQWEMLLWNSSELIQRLVLCIPKRNGFLEQMSKKVAPDPAKAVAMGTRTGLIWQTCPAQSWMGENSSHDDAFPTLTVSPAFYCFTPDKSRFGDPGFSSDLI